MRNYVLVPKAEYEDLLESESILSCLQNHGVDNWVGYSEAIKEFEDNNEIVTIKLKLIVDNKELLDIVTHNFIYEELKD